MGKLVKLSEVEFSLNDIQLLLAKVPDSSIAVCDGVPPTILNKAADTLSTLLYLVFSYVVRTQKWPDTWKCAFVTPVFKKGSRANVENYRPISILPWISLIFEKLLFMYIYGKIKDFLNARQHGFRKKHSTVTQFVLFLHELYLNFDENVEQVVVYLDFCKAFDSVDHSCLLFKVASFGFDKDFVALLSSYLECRRQRVKVGNSLSDVSDVSSGVPQGSVLGPILFLIYIDDMLDIPEFSNVYCFADDTKLVCSEDSCLRAVQSDLQALRLWSYCYSINFNAIKCGYLHFSRTSTDSLCIGSDNISRVDQITDLGIEVSSTLKRSYHVRIKLLKVRRALNYLKHSVPYGLSSGVKFNLYKACVLSVLLYGYPAWYPDIIHMRRLELLNLQGLRWCFGPGDYAGLLITSNSLPVAYQLIESDLRFFSAIMSEQNCLSFNDFFTIETKSVNTRNMDLERLVVSRARKRITEKSFFFRVQRVVNDTADLLNVGISSFKSKNPCQDLIHNCLLNLTKTKYDINNTCTWALKCRCSVCAG